MEDKVVQLKQIIEESDNIVFFGGAGVSTESGIPDFRSVDGLYNQKYKDTTKKTTKKETVSKSHFKFSSAIFKIIIIAVILVILAVIIIFFKKKMDHLNAVRASKRRRNR